MRLSKLLAGLAVASVALAACGTSGGGTANKGTIKIGVDLPESGAEASDGIPTLNGVKYAVQTAGTVEGFTIEVSNLDDAVNGVHDPQKGAQNLQQFVNDSKVLGIVGPFNSSVARAEIPISNRAHRRRSAPPRTSPARTPASWPRPTSGRRASTTTSAWRPPTTCRGRPWRTTRSTSSR